MKIADHVAITRKESKTKTKVPHAISGAECYKLMQSKQDEKQRQQEAKGKRGKTSKNSTKKNGDVAAVISEIVDETVLSLHSDDEDSLGVSSDNEECFACLGREDWNVPNAWIGCSTERCGRWFHKACLSDDVSSMTQQQLKEYDFFCKSCEQKNKK